VTAELPLDPAALGEHVRSLGFDWFGVAAAAPLERELEDLRQWLGDGRHGEMAWLAKEPERRADPARVLEGCRSVIVVGLNYLRDTSFKQSDPTPPGHGRVSKYARSRDYHRVFEKLLAKLCRHIRQEFAPGAEARAYVDYGPVMERPWAERAGLGFRGKHTLLIHPREGSFHFLAVVLTTALIRPTPSPELPMPGCGDCRRCIDACPTGAITEPWKLDARRCLSYLTIEKAGPINAEFWPQFEGNLFGCDICQDVCPYNQSRAKPRSDGPLGEPMVAETLSLAELIRDAEGVLERLGEASSPLKRAGAESLRRNALIVAMERGDDSAKAAAVEYASRPGAPDWLRELTRAVTVQTRPRD
jgi:epoxyqueuosine reductase